MAHDASATWSGFNYQGKVAIYVALKKINELTDEAEYSRYDLVLEHNEDFEIRKDEEPLSFHQVKAVNQTALSNYAHALIELSMGLKKFDNVKGYLHTWKTLNWQQQQVSFQSKVREELQKILDDYNEKVNKDESLIGIALSEQKRINKTSAIIRTKFSMGQAVDNLYREIESLVSSSIPNRCFRYEYPENCYECDLEKIEEFIKVELEQYYQNIDKPFPTDEQKERVFLSFIGLLDRHIIERHKAKSNNDDVIEIKFEEILEFMNTDWELMSEAYVEYRFKEKFLSLFYAYCKDFCELNENEDDSMACFCNECNLKEIVNVLYLKDPQKLFATYQKFLPHKSFENIDTFETVWILSPDILKEVLFEIFYERDCETLLESNNLGNVTYTKFGTGLHYLPTAISSDMASTRRASTLAKDICKNPSSYSTLFQVQRLIAGMKADEVDFSEIDLNKHLDTQKDVMLPGDPVEGQRAKKNKIVDILPEITLIPLSLAKDEINA